MEIARTDKPAPCAFTGETILIATMHGKERVIGPLLYGFLGAHSRPSQGLDTDLFGSFSREVARDGTAFDAARAKLSAARALTPGARFVLASEGSYNAHPLLPGLSSGHELLLLGGPDGSELAAGYSGLAGFHAYRAVTKLENAESFAVATGFPLQGLILMPAADSQPAPGPVVKTATSWPAFRQAAAGLLADHGELWIETDLRAHRSPGRRRAIARATLALVRSLTSPCPACAAPGFISSQAEPGLPCAACSTPTGLASAHIRRCGSCGEHSRTPVRATRADPALCPFCNP